MKQVDRLFQIIDPDTGGLINICYGPGEDGSCPNAAAPPYRCSGRRVVPVRGTRASGLPFTISQTDPGRCPLAWVDSPLSDPLAINYSAHPRLPEPG